MGDPLGSHPPAVGLVRGGAPRRWAGCDHGAQAARSPPAPGRPGFVHQDFSQTPSSPLDRTIPKQPGRSYPADVQGPA